MVIADGHHRYETSLAYKAEREAADGAAGEAGATLAYLVELVEDELTVHAIHRLLSGLPDGLDLVAALAPWFEDAGPPPADRPGHRRDASTPGASRSCSPTARCSCARGPTRSPTPATSTPAASTSPSPRCPPHDLRFQHGVDHVRAAVASGDAQAGVLLRPVTVAQIEATAHGGERMPPKSTFFHPKPKTGLVFRSLG